MINNIKNNAVTIIFIVAIFIIAFWDFITNPFSGWFFLLDFVPVDITIDTQYILTNSVFWTIYNIWSTIWWYIINSHIYIIFIRLMTIYIWYILGQNISNIYNIEDNLHRNVIQIAAIWLFCINPFFVERMATQPWVRNWILFVVFWLYIINGDIKQINEKTNIWKVGILWWLAWAMMSHAIVMIWLISVYYIVNNKFSKDSIKKIIYIIWITVLINVNWIMAAMYGTNKTLSSATSFSWQNIEVFATQSLDPLSVEATSVLGYGFWAEKWNRVNLVNETNKIRYIYGIIIIWLWIYGIIWEYRNQKYKTTIYIITMVMVLRLWIWISNNIWSDLIKWIYENISIYRGFREPHKWIWIYILLTIPYIIRWFVKLSQKIDYTILLPVFIFVLYGWSPSIINMSWLYKPTDYPNDYKLSKQYILDKYPDSNLILLPWHSYMKCDWTNNVISILWKEFYHPANVVVSDNIEMWWLYTNNSSEISNTIDKYIQNENKEELDEIVKLWFDGFIVWKNCADIQNYKWLDGNQQLNKVYSGEKSDIYIIK